MFPSLLGKTTTFIKIGHLCNLLKEPIMINMIYQAIVAL